MMEPMLAMHDAIWAPWRLAYLRDLERRESEARSSGAAPDGAPQPEGDFLRTYWLTPDADRASLVVHRTDRGLILLNRYPYINGHLLVALGEARPTLAEYAESDRLAFWELVERAMELARRTLGPQGLNVGINEGRAAGAGLPQHVHAHVVPRWSGDVNFLSVVGQVRIIPDALEETWRAYRRSVEALGW